MNCGNCSLKIDQFEVYIEYDDSFYHEKCYNCSYCLCSFSFEDKQSDDKVCLVPLKDKNNRLFCINDFIRTLKCSVCCLNFEPNSQIHKLKKSLNEDVLAHVDCVKCNSCETKINISTEYMIEENTNGCIHLTCKCCCTHKPCESTTKHKHKNRLSSRQKDILRSKFIQSESLKNNDLVLTEESLFVCNLAREIGCTKKSIVDFISKRRENMLNQSSGATGLGVPKLDKIIEELKSIDRALAPNQSPFTQGVHKSFLLKV